LRKPLLLHCRRILGRHLKFKVRSWRSLKILKRVFNEFYFIFSDIEEKFLPEDYLLKRCLKSLLHILESNPPMEVFKELRKAITYTVDYTSPFFPFKYFFERFTYLFNEKKPINDGSVGKEKGYDKVMEFITACYRKEAWAATGSLLPLNWSCVRDAKLISDARELYKGFGLVKLEQYPILRFIHDKGLWFRFYEMVQKIEKSIRDKTMFLMDLNWEFRFIEPKARNPSPGDNVLREIQREEILERIALRNAGRRN